MPIDLGYDEGGSADTMLVSMQLAITEQAQKLKRKWNKELGHVPYFHSKDFSNLSYGVFAGLDRRERTAMLSELSKIGRQHLSIGMTAKVTKSIYEQKTTPLFRSKWGTAYTFCIQMLLVSAYLYAEHVGIKPEFNILVEDGHTNANQALGSLQDTKKAGTALAIPVEILTIRLGSKSDNPILQAADMLAYSEWQKMSGGDLAIYDAMHSPTMRFQPEFLDFDDELVDVVSNGAEQWLAHRKAWGQKRPRTRV